MILLDANTNTAAAAQTAKALSDNSISDSLKNLVPPEVAAFDSTRQTIGDSIKNMSVSDVKGIITGENTLLKDALSSFVDMTVAFLPKLIGCIIVLWIGFKLIKLLKRTLTKVLDKREAEPSLKGFLTSLVDILMKVMLIIMAMDIIGIKATSFIAILGAAGLAIGMALQGTLQNFAGGVIILLLKPFKVGDYIECGSYKGYVRDIHIFHTIIRPFNGRIIIVPNSDLATTSLINHTKENVIRLEIISSTAYGTDSDRVREVIMQVINDDELILKDPIPKTCVSELGNSSVNWSIWVWVKVEDYWTVWMRIRENIYKAFNANGIPIPFPQMDVHLKDGKA